MAAGQDSIQKLSSDYWNWRAEHQPFNNDDIPRIERPAGLKYSWSAAVITEQRKDLSAFEGRWKAMAGEKRSVAQQVDYELLGSALARVHWELDVNRRWLRDPSFYVEQTMTAFTEILLPPPPFDATRSHEVISRLENIPGLLDEAKANLQQPGAPFARLAIDSLKDIRGSLDVVRRELEPSLAPEDRAQFGPAIAKATSALEGYRDWLQQQLPSMTTQTAIGREAYIFFFKNVALYPFTPEELLAMSRQEWARSVAGEQLERQHNLKVPPLKMFRDVNEQVAATAEREKEIRRYLVV